LSGGTRFVKIVDIVVEADDILSFVLVDRDGKCLPDAAPGSHIDIHLPLGFVRQYSLTNGPHDLGYYRIAVKREASGRGGSAFLHDVVKKGDFVSISEPRNNFPLNISADKTVLLAGGIGITPLLSMAKRLNTLGAKFELHYFARSRQHAAFREILSSEDYKSAVNFEFGLDSSAVKSRLEQVLKYSTGTHAYICGPVPFIDTAKMAAEAWPEEAVHIEYFAVTPVTPVAAADGGGSFSVKLAKSGATFNIPSGKSIVDVLTENGVHVDVSCEQGICGTCVTRVLEGEPSHRDMYLTKEQRAAGSMTICVSRAKSRILVLDI
jgi:vanillate O-demethylase ferredoxin subunit